MNTKLGNFGVLWIRKHMNKGRLLMNWAFGHTKAEIGN
jgi:hypothetical protein